MVESTLTTSATVRPLSQGAHSRSHEKDDAFLKLTNVSREKREILAKQEEEEKKKESLFCKIILAPIIAISFILSLAYVDFQNRRFRVAQRPVRTGSWSPLRRAKTWLNPEPYQSDSDDAEEWIRLTERSNTGETMDGDARPTMNKQKRKSWSIQKKHRVVTKMMLTDAWDLHQRMMIIIGGAVVIFSLIVYAAFRYLY